MFLLVKVFLFFFSSLILILKHQVGEVSLAVSTASGNLREELQKLSMGEILGVSDEDDDEITALDFQLGKHKGRRAG